MNMSDSSDPSVDTPAAATVQPPVPPPNAADRRATTTGQDADVPLPDSDPDPDGGDTGDPVETDADPDVVDASAEAEPAPTPRPSDRTAYSALATFPALGDPGRQREVVPVFGKLTVGVSDTELDLLTIDPFEVRACASRGMSHRLAGTPRQDAFAVNASDGWVVVAVADGVSSGAHSHVAAETAARAAARLVIARLGQGEPDWVAMCGRISRRLIDEAQYRQLVSLPDDVDVETQIRTVRNVMSTTLVVAAVRRQPEADGSFAGLLAVLAGDSGAYLLGDGRLTSLAGGKVGDATITSTSVDPLPGSAAPVAVPFELGAAQALIVTSDGLGDPVGSGDTEVGRHLARRWASPPGPAEFLNDVNLLRRTFDDDRTAVGLWVLPPRDT